MGIAAFGQAFFSPRPVYRYFEELIAKAIAADAEANAPADEGLSEEERLEVARLRLEVEAFSDKYEGLLTSLRKDEVGKLLYSKPCWVCCDVALRCLFLFFF